MAIIYDQNNALKPPTLNDIGTINGRGAGFGSMDINNDEEININSTSAVSFNADGGLNFNNISLFNQYIFFTGYTTAEILAFTVDAGTQAFCSTINQFVFYQVSTITGLVLGWYNSTGSIKL